MKRKGSALYIALMLIFLITLSYFIFNRFTVSNVALFRKSMKNLSYFYVLKSVNEYFWQELDVLIKDPSSKFYLSMLKAVGKNQDLTNETEEMYKRLLIQFFDCMGIKFGGAVKLDKFKLVLQNQQSLANGEEMKRLGISPIERKGEIVLKVKLKTTDGPVILNEKRKFKIINITPLSGRFTLFVKQLPYSKEKISKRLNTLIVNKDDKFSFSKNNKNSLIVCENAVSVAHYYLNSDNISKNIGWIYIGNRINKAKKPLILNETAGFGCSKKYNKKFGELFKFYAPYYLSLQGSKVYFSKNLSTKNNVKMKLKYLPLKWRKNFGGLKLEIYQMIFGHGDYVKKELDDIFGNFSQDDLNLASGLHLYGVASNPTPTLVFGNIYSSYFRLSALWANKGGDLIYLKTIPFKKKDFKVPNKAGNIILPSSITGNNLANLASKTEYSKINTRRVIEPYNYNYFRLIPFLAKEGRSKVIWDVADVMKKYKVDFSIEDMLNGKCKIQLDKITLFEGKLNSFDLLKSFEKRVVYEIRDINGNKSIDDEINYFLLQGKKINLSGAVVKVKGKINIPSNWKLEKLLLGMNGGVLLADSIELGTCSKLENTAPLVFLGKSITVKHEGLIPAYIGANDLNLPRKSKPLKVLGGVYAVFLNKAKKRLPNLYIKWSKLYDCYSDNYNANWKFFVSKSGLLW